MSGTQTGTGTSFGSVQNTMPNNTLTFEAAIAANNDNTPPEITLLNSAAGTVTVGAFEQTLPITSQATGGNVSGYPVTVSGLAVGTTIVQIAGDNVDDGYITATLNPAPTEEFVVNQASIALVPPTQAQTAAVKA